MIRHSSEYLDRGGVPKRHGRQIQIGIVTVNCRGIMATMFMGSLGQHWGGEGKGRPTSPGFLQ